MMEIFGGIVLAVLCIAGMTAMMETLCDWLLQPEKEDPMIVLIPMRGHCEDAEAVLRGAVYRMRRWNTENPLLLCVDCGMDAETRVICSRICMDADIPLVEEEKITSYFRCNRAEDDV